MWYSDASCLQHSCVTHPWGDSLWCAEAFTNTNAFCPAWYGDAADILFHAAVLKQVKACCKAIELSNTLWQGKEVWQLAAAVCDTDLPPFAGSSRATDTGTACGGGMQASRCRCPF